MLPDASKAYAVNKNDRPFITVIDLKARKIAGHISVPNGTEGVCRFTRRETRGRAGL